MHFPEELTIKSDRLRLRRQRAARQEVPRVAHRAAARRATKGWLAEHMLIIGIENPDGENTTSPRRSRPRAARTQPRDAGSAEAIAKPGWKVWTVGDDICWMQTGADGTPVGDQSGGRLTSASRRARARRRIPTRWRRSTSDAIFTNVAVDRRQTSRGGKACGGQARRSSDWQGAPVRSRATAQPAHPNSRFTVPREAKPELVADARRRRRACRSRRSCSAAGAAYVAAARVRGARLGPRRARWRARWARRRPPPRPARSACCAATRWR